MLHRKQKQFDQEFFSHEDAIKKFKNENEEVTNFIQRNTTKKIEKSKVWKPSKIKFEKMPFNFSNAE